MARALYLCSLLLCTGCSGFGFGHLSFRQTTADSPNCLAEPVAEESNGQPVCRQPAIGCKAEEEIHVHVPQQKITVKRAKPCAPSAAPPAAAVPSQEVLLIPRTVYLPYAPQIPTGPARMVPLQTAPAQTTAMIPMMQAPAACGTNAQTGLNLAETQKQVEELGQRLQMLEGTLQRLNQTAVQLGISAPNQAAPRTPPNRESDLSAPNR